MGGVPRRSGYGARAASGRRERERLHRLQAVTPLLIASKSGNASDDRTLAQERRGSNLANSLAPR